MGHATHFLERLDRVKNAHVERALALYRDDDLLKSVLSSVELPEGCDRLAVSLDHPSEGPFVVLTRSGRFVTCLGAGMRVDLPVVTRERFDAAAARVQRMRDELDRVRQVVDAGIGTQLTRVLKNLMDNGARFCREDAVIAARVQPLLAAEFASALMNTIQGARDEAPRVATLRFERLSVREREYVEKFGCSVWATAHLLPFMATPEARPVLSAVTELAQMEVLCAHRTFSWGTMMHATRSLWTVARSSKEGLQYLKTCPKTGPNLAHRMFREHALGAIAAKSPKLRGEALKALFSKSACANDQSLDALMDDLARWAAGQIEFVVSKPATDVQMFIESGRDIAALIRGKPEGGGSDLPDDVALSLYTSFPQSWLSRPSDTQIGAISHALPWLVQMPVEQLYLPRVWADEFLPAPSVREIDSWFSGYKKNLFLGRPATDVRKQAKLGRNDPCSCGSGKKWKHCCASAPAS